MILNLKYILGLTQLLWLIRPQSNNLRLSEEIPIGSEIDISQHLTYHSNLKNDLNNEELIIINKQSHGVSSFKVKRQDLSIKLAVVSRIDRERLCPNSKRQKKFQDFIVRPPLHTGGYHQTFNTFHHENIEPCLISIKFSLGENLDSIDVEIMDINDNSPEWSLPNYGPRYVHKINLKDGDPVNTKILLPLAEDPDTFENGQIVYSISTNDIRGMNQFNDNSWSDVFVLEKIQSTTDPKESQLILRSLVELDREVYQDGWKLFLVATDNGQPEKRQSRLPLEITINDLNDNSPKFSQPEYSNLDVQENAQIGEVLLKVEANDPDEGKNGQIAYSIMTSDDNLKSYIEISQSGEIRLRKSLQVDKTHGGDGETSLGKDPITFKVRAQDKADQPYSLYTEVPVTIKINDINDESPNIQVHPLRPKGTEDHTTTSIDGNSERIQLYLEENKTNSLIALIQVSDSDYEGKDVVNCQIQGVDGQKFHLDKTSSTNEYKLTAIDAWDREKYPNLELYLTCQDSVGHTAQKLLLIKILDFNDNDPVLSQPLMKFKIREDDGEQDHHQRLHYFSDNNNKQKWETTSGMAVIKASDADEVMTQNSKLKYSIRPKDEEGNKGRNIEELFQIDPETGVLSSRGILDRELQQVYTFLVTVEDSGEMPRTVTGQVEVELTDVNDNPPSFVVPQANQHGGYSFSVEENSPIGSLIGSILAVDPDDRTEIGKLSSGSDENQITIKNSIFYSLDKSKDAEAFRIDSRTGEIFIKRHIDREKSSSYTFKAYALDGQSKYQRLKSVDPETAMHSETDSNPDFRVHIVSVNIYIAILDVNDNPPRFIRPNFTNHLVELDPNAEIGTNIFTINAEDPDDGLNSRIVYKILDENPQNIFNVYAHNGEVYLENKPSEEMIAKAKRIHDEITSIIRLGNNNDSNKRYLKQLEETLPMFMLKLEACDMADTPKCTIFPNFQIQLRYPDANRSPLGEEDTYGYGGPMSLWGNGFSNRFSNGQAYGRTFSENLAIGLSVFFSIIVIVIALIICFIRLRSRNIYGQDNSEQFKYVSNPHSQTLLLKDQSKYPMIRGVDQSQLMNPYETIAIPADATPMIHHPSMIYDRENSFMTIDSRTAGGINHMMKVVKPLPAGAYHLHNTYKPACQTLTRNCSTSGTSRTTSSNVPINYDSLRSQAMFDNSMYNEYQTIPLRSDSNEPVLTSHHGHLSDETMSCGSIEVSNINKNSSQNTKTSSTMNAGYSETKCELKPGEPLPTNLILPKSTFV